MNKEFGRLDYQHKAFKLSANDTCKSIEVVFDAFDKDEWQFLTSIGNVAVFRKMKDGIVFDDPNEKSN